MWLDEVKENLFEMFSCEYVWTTSVNAPQKLSTVFTTNEIEFVGSRPSDHYFRSVCLFVCLFVCAEFFSAVLDPISIKLGYMLYVWV